MIKYIIIALVICNSMFFTSCQTQEQKAIVSKEYILLDTTLLPFQIEYASSAQIISKKEEANTFWFDIVYPKENACIYCSYFHIQDNFRQLNEDVRRFVYRHTVVATDIKETLYSTPFPKTAAMLFEIEGEVASPLQFMITDSTNHFLRGALYFESTPNKDSTQTALKEIQTDILHLIQTIKWRE